jgi:hypothetical protein
LLSFSVAAAQLSVLESAEEHFSKGRYEQSLQQYGEIIKNPFASPSDTAISQCRIGVIHSIQNRLSEARRMLEDAVRAQALPAKHASICHYALLQVYVLGGEDIEARALIKRMGEPTLAAIYQARTYALASEIGARLGDSRFEIVNLQKLRTVMEQNKFTEIELKSLNNKKISLQEIVSRLSAPPPAPKPSPAPTPVRKVTPKPTPTPTSTPVPAVVQAPAVVPPSQAAAVVTTSSTTTPLGAAASSAITAAPLGGSDLENVFVRMLAFLNDGDISSALSYVQQNGESQLQSAVSQFGFGVSSAQIVSRLSRLAADDPRAVRVGVILPASDFFTRFNSRVLRAVSSFSASTAVRGVNFSFVVKGVSPDSGAFDSAAFDLVFNDHVHAIVGPISNSQALGVAGISHLFRVPFFALGPVVSAPELTSDALVRLGVLARSQTSVLVKHLQQELKLKNAAIFAPNDAYGSEMAKAFSDVAAELQFPIQNSRFYPATADVLKSDVEAVVGPQDKESRKEEYESLLKIAKEKALQEKKRFDPKRVILPPLLPYDALFVPEALGKSRVIASTFAYFGVENARMLGDRQWLEGLGRTSIADPFMNGARIPVPLEGDFLQFLIRDLSTSSHNIDLERQVFDALILLRTAQFKSGGNVGARLVRALHSIDMSARGTMVFGPVDSSGEPSVQFHLMNYHNGRVSVGLAPWPSIISDTSKENPALQTR